jgi:hypothetical protein
MKLITTIFCLRVYKMEWVFKKEERIGGFALSVFCYKIVFVVAAVAVDAVVVVTL